MASKIGLRSLGLTLIGSALFAPSAWAEVIADVQGGQAVVGEAASAGASASSLYNPDSAPATVPFQPDIPSAPALKGMGATPINVLGFHISGNTVFSDETLLSLINDQLDRSLTLSELKVVADRITRYYREHGYFLTYAYVPVQEIMSGVVEIAVIEGRIGLIQFNNNNEYWLSRSTVGGYLTRMRQTSVANLDGLERDMLLLNDLPGIDAVATLKPGAQVGTTDVNVTLSDAPVASGSLDFNNFGSRYNGEYRFGATLEVNNPLTFGDRIKLRPLLTSGGETRYGMVSYSFPVDYWGTRVGVRFSKMLTALSEEFSPAGLENHVQVSELFVTHPFIRTNRLNLIGEVDFTHNEVKQVWRKINGFDTVDDYSLVTLSTVVDGYDNLLGGGTNQASLSIGFVSDGLGNDKTLAATSDTFTKVNYSLSRNQSLSRKGYLNLYMKAHGQVSSAKRELVSTEQYSLGGPNAVRAYPSGEAMSDNANIINLELRWNLFYKHRNSMADTIQLYPFYDVGSGSRDNAAGTTYERSAVGLGLRIGKTGSYLIDISAARTANGQEALSEEVDNKIWASVIKWF